MNNEKKRYVHATSPTLLTKSIKGLKKGNRESARMKSVFFKGLSFEYAQYDRGENEYYQCVILSNMTSTITLHSMSV